MILFERDDILYKRAAHEHFVKCSVPVFHKGGVRRQTALLACYAQKRQTSQQLRQPAASFPLASAAAVRDRVIGSSYRCTVFIAVGLLYMLLVQSYSRGNHPPEGHDDE